MNVTSMKNLAVVCLLVSLNVNSGLGGKSCMRRRLNVSWQNVHQACRVPFEAAHDINAALYEIIEHGMDGSPADAISGAVEHVEKACYDQARDSIAAVGMLLQEHEELRDIVAFESARSPCERGASTSAANNPDV